MPEQKRPIDGKLHPALLRSFFSVLNYSRQLKKKNLFVHRS